MTQKTIKLNEFEQIMEALPFFNKAPTPAYLTVSQYAHRLNIKPNAIRAKIINGKIDTNFCATTHRSPAKDGRRKMLIHWNKTVNGTIKTIREDKWPEDFDPESDDVYDEIDEGLNSFEETIVLGKKGPKRAYQKKQSADAVSSLAEAKLERERVKLRRELADEKLANNQVIEVEAVEAFLIAFATELKGLIAKAINLSSAELFAGHQMVAKRTVLQGYFERAFSCLETLTDFVENYQQGNELNLGDEEEFEDEYAE